MKIIRAFWGSQEKTWAEVPNKPIFDNEVVYVYGRENYERFRAMGYEVVLMHYDPTEPKYSTVYDHFVHKLVVLKMAEHAYGEYLFLDWDVHVVKPIDFAFWELIKNRGHIQCPVYAYPKNYESKILEHIKNNPQKDWVKKLDPNTYEWIKIQNQLLEKYNWNWEDLQVVPNFCFFYSRYTNVASDLLEIYEKDGIKTCIEEFAMFILAECSLDEFIAKYEPVVIRGREDNCYHFDLTEDDTMARINKYVASKINKNIYLIHE
jgi:hypothetical protein